MTALFGGSTLLLNRMIREIGAEDFDISHRSANVFRFPGNGFTEWEMKPDSDLAWYVEAPDSLDGDKSEWGKL